MDQITEEEKITEQFIDIIQKELQIIMNTIQQAVDAVKLVEGKIDTLITETTNADNRFDAKIAALQSQVNDLQTQIATGADATPVLDALTPIGQKIDNATAAQQLEGV